MTGFLVVRTHLPEAPRLSPAFDDFSRKARNVTAGVPDIPYHPNYFAEITSLTGLPVGGQLSIDLQPHRRHSHCIDTNAVA